MARIDGEIVIAAPVEQVFDMVADERNEPRYYPRIVRAQKTSHGPIGRGARFTAQPKGMGARGVMTIEVVDYHRPGRLATSIRSSYMDADGTNPRPQPSGFSDLHLTAAPRQLGRQPSVSRCALLPAWMSAANATRGATAPDSADPEQTLLGR